MRKKLSPEERARRLARRERRAERRALERAKPAALPQEIAYPRKPCEDPYPSTITDDVLAKLQSYSDRMTSPGWTQGASSHQVVEACNGYLLLDCRHGTDGQGSAYFRNAMPALIAEVRRLRALLSTSSDAIARSDASPTGIDTNLLIEGERDEH